MREAGERDVPRRGRLAAGALAVAALAASAVLPSGAAAEDLVRASGPGDPEGPRVETATNARKVYYRAEESIKLYYRVTDPKPVEVKIDLINDSSGRVIETWRPPPVESDEVQRVRWRGVIDGDLRRDGRYRFRLTAEDSQGFTSSSAAEGDRDRDAFRFYRNYFPVRGRHTYGDGFGAGRGHRGQDVFADCGTDLQAARGGTVQTRAYHSAAGYYLVIDGKKTKVDYVYMHLRRPSPRREGERVRTGQRLGNVGQSGNASGCHLHFELWSGPGWYEGGDAFDATPSLKYWDSYS